MQEALMNPFNQRFQLLCDTTVPIQDALWTHTQLMAVAGSRVGEHKDVRPVLTP